MNLLKTVHEVLWRTKQYGGEDGYKFDQYCQFGNLYPLLH